MRFMRPWPAAVLQILAAVALGILVVPSANAKTFRWANDGDVTSMDPYFAIETSLQSFMANIYEPLTRRGGDLKLEPALATEWSQIADKVWRYKLRTNVKFHDGTPFTADDVIFSHQRASGPGSAIKATFASVEKVVKVNDYTVDFVTRTADPILPEQFSSWLIMSKSWAEKNGAEQATAANGGRENLSTRNAMGTGPFVLKSREPGVQTTMVANPSWWDKPVHNLTEVIFQRIPNDATRVAALLSGDIDMIYTTPPSSVEKLRASDAIKVVEGPELRTIMLGLDVSRAELTDSSVTGTNPFKDIRVREAFYRAIDVEGIRSKVMRGQAMPTALMVAPGVRGFNGKLNARPAFDPERAKKLLADAGYAAGFEVGLDCPNDRYINDEAICQAVANMLAKIGIKIRLRIQDRTRFFTKIFAPNYNTGFYMLGWTPSSYDIHTVLERLLYTRGLDAFKGLYNIGGFSNPDFDKLVDSIAVELDEGKRTALIDSAIRIVQDNWVMIPLHQQTVVWAMKKGVSVKLYADNFFPLRWVRVE